MGEHCWCQPNAPTAASSQHSRPRCSGAPPALLQRSCCCHHPLPPPPPLPLPAAHCCRRSQLCRRLRLLPPCSAPTCVGISLARCSSFSSSSRVHSVFLMAGSSHSYLRRCTTESAGVGERRRLAGAPRNPRHVCRDLPAWLRLCLPPRWRAHGRRSCACACPRGRGVWEAPAAPPPPAGPAHQRALHCLALLRTSSEEMRAHWFSPYLRLGVSGRERLWVQARGTHAGF